VWDYFGLTADRKGTMMWQFAANVTTMFVLEAEIHLTYSHLWIPHPLMYTQVLQAHKDKAEESLTASSSSTSQATLPELFTKMQKYKRTTK